MDLQILDFYGTWCAPCRALAPVLEDVSKELDIKVTKINVDEDIDSLEDYEIRSIPTLVFIKEGIEVGRFSGSMTKDKLIEKIKSL